MLQNAPECYITDDALEIKRSQKRICHTGRRIATQQFTLAVYGIARPPLPCDETAFLKRYPGCTR